MWVILFSERGRDVMGGAALLTSTTVLSRGHTATNWNLVPMMYAKHPFWQDVTRPPREGYHASFTWRMSCILHVTDITPPPYVYSVIKSYINPMHFHCKHHSSSRPQPVSYILNTHILLHIVCSIYLALSRSHKLASQPGAQAIGCTKIRENVLDSKFWNTLFSYESQRTSVLKI